MKPTIEPLKIGIAAIKKSHQERERWQKTFDEMFNGRFVPTYNETLEVALVDVLQKIYNDSDTLDWWIYEMEFGTKAGKGSMTDKNVQEIPMRTVEDLYRYYEKYTLNQKRKKANEKDSRGEDNTKTMEEVCQILEEAILKQGK